MGTSSEPERIDREIAGRQTSFSSLLSRLFAAVSRILGAESIQEKFDFAADALCEGDPFVSCLILYEVGPGDWYCSGVGVDCPGHPEEVFRQYYGDAASAGDLPLIPETIDGSTMKLILPLLSGEGRLSGLVRLQLKDGSIDKNPAPMELVDLFMEVVVQSVERFRVQHDLEHSEASYRLLIDNVSDVIFRLDNSGRFLFASRRVQDVLGITWREILGHHFWEFLRASDADSAQQRFRDLVAGHSTTQHLNIIRPDGGEIIMHVSVDPVIENGKVIGALGVARDVTEKRKFENQIAGSERRYRALMENAYDAVFVVDVDSLQILDVNPRAEELSGFARNDLLGMNLHQLRRQDQIHMLRSRMEAIMREGKGRYDDAPLLRRDGFLIDVDTAVSTLELEGRHLYHVIMRDASEQKRMTRELNRRVMELQVLTDVTDALQASIDPESVMSIVLAGVTAGSALGFNRAFILSYDESRHQLRGEAGVGPGSVEEASRIWRELTEKSLTLSELLRRKATSIVREEDAASRLANELVIPLDEEYEIFGSVLHRKEALVITPEDGGDSLPESFYKKYIAREFALVPLITRDDVMGVMLADNLVTAAPITDRDLQRLKLFANSAASAIERSRLLQSLEKRLHELTLANRELKISQDRLVKTERLSAIGEVAASVAHEIRNPLVAIGGFARSMLQGLPEDDRNKAKVRVIVEETDRLERILSELLEYSRPAVPRFAAMDLNGLILQTIHFMSAEIDDRLIRISFDLQEDAPHVWADAQQIRQVILNLLRNAVQAMPNGGEIRVKTTAHDSQVIASVEDSGPGLSEDVADRIFDAFFTTKPTGSGLGLAICAQIVRNHNGRIFAEPGSECGARFVLSLPSTQRRP